MEEKEIKERKHLSQTKERLSKSLDDISEKLKRFGEDIKAEAKYLGEARYDMDHGEKINARQSIEYIKIFAKETKNQKKRVEKLLDSPYFGRFDFQADGKKSSAKIYLGIHHFYDNYLKKSLVYDWRAPISSVFYNYEMGPSQYEAPSGLIKGEVSLKRQFSIKRGEMEFMLESAISIVDDILQKELSQASDDGMKNIVATIQRDQNAIIRNEDSRVLIIQGVAGSGKTSIALHRIAFLLYRFREKLTSDDILIISPNEVFADYISNVLPELGEEKVGEVQMETLARELLSYKYDFESFFEQSANLLETEDEKLKKRIKIKSSQEFLNKIEKYSEEVNKNIFKGFDFRIANCFVPGWVFDEAFLRNIRHEKKDIISKVSKEVEQKISLEYDYDLKAGERSELKKAVSKMYNGDDILTTYKKFFEYLASPDLFKIGKNKKLEYSDVFPFVYLKIILEGKSVARRQVKHLIIDEMQDYTPVQYAVLNRLFDCNKTILGDANQSVNPYSSSSAELIKETFPDSQYVELNKSYRSTYEIMKFALKISPNKKLEAMERHGEVPKILACENRQEEIKKITNICQEFKKSTYNTLGIICKTQKEAEEVSQKLEKNEIKNHLLKQDSRSFDNGVIICTAHMAKGLEFDQVIIPGASDNNYKTIMDKNLLYVATTRAMHSLYLTYSENNISDFIK